MTESKRRAALTFASELLQLLARYHPECVIEGASMLDESLVLSESFARLVTDGRPEHHQRSREVDSRFSSALAQQALQSLVSNKMVFPSRDDIALLRTDWATEPMGYRSKASRADVAAQLIHTAASELPDGMWQSFLRRITSVAEDDPAERAIRMLRDRK